MISEEEKIYNSIAFQEGQIEEIKKVKQQVALSETKDIRIKIETKHWYGYSEPFLAKKKHKILLQKSTMIAILNGIQSKCRERIDKLIDMEIERRKNVKTSTEKKL